MALQIAKTEATWLLNEDQFNLLDHLEAIDPPNMANQIEFATGLNPASLITELQPLSDAGVWSAKAVIAVLHYHGLTGLPADEAEYLVEQYSIARLTEGSWDKIGRKDLHASKLVALGVSREYPGFPALPHVNSEIDGIVWSGDDDSVGVLPGTARLNELFTRDEFENLMRRNSILHVASHFYVSPENDKKSVLLLGSGETLSLATVVDNNYDFGDIQLLTLSACETASSGAFGKGSEVQSFAELVHEQGAGSVITSLWPVADESTSIFMRSLYDLMSQGNSKVAAMRQTQIAFIRGDFKPDFLSDQYDSIRGGGFNSDADTNSVSVEINYSHPYYWSPFVLMGDWL